MRQRTKSTLAVIFIAAMFVMMGWVEGWPKDCQLDADCPPDFYCKQVRLTQPMGVCVTDRYDYGESNE